MAKSVKSIKIYLFALASFVFSEGIVYSDPLPIHVNLVLEKDTYSLQPSPEWIPLSVSMENRGNAPIFASDGFSRVPLYLFITFIRPDGKGITAPKLGEGDEAVPPPRVLLVGDQFVQVDTVELLLPGDIASVSLPNAHSFYPNLTQCGRYTAKVAVPIRTYPAINHTVGGVNFANLDSANFAEVLESDPVSFVLTADTDGDGVLCPEDCDDMNAQIHPGRTEVTGNGLDDDCNPATLDVVPEPSPPTWALKVKAVKKKVLVDGVVVRLFDKKSSCVTQFKGKQKLQSIWLNCPAQVNGQTGATATAPGLLDLAVPPGEYLLIAEYDPDSAPLSGNESLLGVQLGKVKAGKTKKGVLNIKDKKLQNQADSGDDIAPDLSDKEE